MLVAAVMYHSNLAAQAPPTGRLSIADDVMLTTYSLITLNFAVCLVIIKLDSGGNKEWAQELHGTLERCASPGCVAQTCLVVVRAVR